MKPKLGQTTEQTIIHHQNNSFTPPANGLPASDVITDVPVKATDTGRVSAKFDAIRMAEDRRQFDVDMKTKKKDVECFVIGNLVYETRHHGNTTPADPATRIATLKRG
ncbi:hypothetical protein TWF696_007219 [Orbilia brochopaga]|uniref:Uncharacterized protein n=1 Tax=Orbilia brochopaga TaxID=3140254 RepID=A0AAV9UUK0_9PEZI